MRTKSCDLEKRKKKEKGEKKHFQNKSAVTFFTSHSANGPPHLIKGEKGSSSTAKARIVLFPRIPRPTSHSLQSFREERFSAALMQCDGKKKTTCDRKAEMASGQFNAYRYNINGEKRHVDRQRAAAVVKCCLLMYKGDSK